LFLRVAHWFYKFHGYRCFLIVQQFMTVGVVVAFDDILWQTVCGIGYVRLGEAVDSLSSALTLLVG